MSANFNRRLTVVVLAAAMFVCSSGIAAEIPWSTDIEDALQRATENGQPVLMEFTADWCGYCKKMEKTTFTDPDVAQRISRNFVAVKVDADQAPAGLEAGEDRFGVPAQPNRAIDHDLPGPGREHTQDFVEQHRDVRGAGLLHGGAMVSEGSLR